MSTYTAPARPDFVEIPNLSLDQMLALTEAELKVLLFVVRQTLGYSRDSVMLTYSQIAYGTYGDDGRLLDRGTGLCQKSIGRAVRLLSEKGYLQAQNAGRVRRPTVGAEAVATGTAAIYSLGMRLRPPRRWID